jgi:hypothetical protein
MKKVCQHRKASIFQWQIVPDGGWKCPRERKTPQGGQTLMATYCEREFFELTLAKLCRLCR